MHAYGHIVGWRGLFVVGALPALLIFYIGSRVKESPAWEAKRRGIPGSPVVWGETPLSERMQQLWQFRYRFLFLVLLMAGFNALSHGTQDLYPTFLLHDHHASAHMVGAIGILYNIGAILGGICFGALSDRWGRKRSIVTAALLALPCIPLFALGHSLVLLAVGAFLMQFMVQGAWGVVPAYLIELSPEPVRATFPGFAYQLGNLLTSRNSVFQAQAARRYGGLGPVLAVTVLVVAAYLAIVASLGRESRGQTLL
jgi:SHS family lactate transporter-like MFS transporter